MRVKVSLLIAGVLFYLSSTSLVGGAALWLTLRAYAVSGESLSATTSAAVLNTAAATLLWLAFFGGFDMFLTLWTIMQNRQNEAYLLHREETERKDREAREKDMKAERDAHNRELEAQRTFQQAILDQLVAEREENRRVREEERQEREQFFTTLLQAERERSDLLMTRLLDLTDRLDKRNNNGNGIHNAE